MKKGLISGLVILLVVFAFTANGFSAENKSKKDSNVAGEKAAKESDEAKAVADLNLAGRLSEYGKRTENPMALLLAAQIFKNTPTKDQKREKTTTGKVEADAKYSGFNTPEQLLSEAKKMANDKGMDTVAAMIDKESQIVASRSRLEGPLLHTDRVSAETTDKYTINFRGRELARVGVIGDGKSDLDLYVFDQSGNLICKDEDSSSNCICQWIPRRTAGFTIKINNRGRYGSEYILMSD